MIFSCALLTSWPIQKYLIFLWSIIQVYDNNQRLSSPSNWTKGLFKQSSI